LDRFLRQLLSDIPAVLADAFACSDPSVAPSPTMPSGSIAGASLTDRESQKGESKYGKFIVYKNVKKED
jgi:hypothetical protein